VLAPPKEEEMEPIRWVDPDLSDSLKCIRCYQPARFWVEVNNDEKKSMVQNIARFPVCLSCAVMYEDDPVVFWEEGGLRK